jgi:adenylate kinase family enzyme
LGGFPGAGKTTMAKRLSAAWRIPRLSSDMLGQIIAASNALKQTSVDAYWIAYDVVFGLCTEFLTTGVSTILDINMGWAFQWQQLDALKHQHPDVRWLPILLQCSREICLQRIGHRYADDPAAASPPEIYTTTPHILNVWSFLERLNRPDTYVIDAGRPLDEVYADIAQYLAQQISGDNEIGPPAFG